MPARGRHTIGQDSGPWYDERNNVVELLAYLDERAELTLPLALQLVEKPWHWTLEYDVMRKGQRDLARRTEAAA